MRHTMKNEATDAAIYDRALKSLARSDFDSVIEDLAKLSERQFRDSESQLAYALVRSGAKIEDFQRAQRLFESYIAVNKSDYHARKNLAYLKSTKTGDQKGALAIYQELLDEGNWECAHNIALLAERNQVTQDDLVTTGSKTTDENYAIAASHGHIFSKLAIMRRKKSQSIVNLLTYWTFRLLIAPVQIIAISLKNPKDRRLLV